MPAHNSDGKEIYALRGWSRHQCKHQMFPSTRPEFQIPGVSTINKMPQNGWGSARERWTPTCSAVWSRITKLAELFDSSWPIWRNISVRPAALPVAGAFLRDCAGQLLNTFRGWGGVALVVASAPAKSIAETRLICRTPRSWFERLLFQKLDQFFDTQIMRIHGGRLCRLRHSAHVPE